MCEGIDFLFIYGPNRTTNIYTITHNRLDRVSLLCAHSCFILFEWAIFLSSEQISLSNFLSLQSLVFNRNKFWIYIILTKINVCKVKDIMENSQYNWDKQRNLSFTSKMLPRLTWSDSISVPRSRIVYLQFIVLLRYQPNDFPSNLGLVLAKIAYF